MFKYKPDRVRFDVKINTIDGMHKKTINDFKNKRNSIPSKINKLNKLKHKLNDINTKKKCTLEDVKKKSTLKTEIEELQNEIQSIKHNFDELNYMFLTIDILPDYYENNHKISKPINYEQEENKDDFTDSQEKLKKLNKLNNKNIKLKKIPKKRWKKKNQSKTENILNLLKKSNSIEEPKLDSTTEKPEKKKRKQKAKMLDDYLILTESTYISNKKHRYNPDFSCPNCNIDRKIIHAEGIFVCISCGEAESIIVDSERPNYKDNVPEKAGYPYKRINHFLEFRTRVIIIFHL